MQLASELPRECASASRATKSPPELLGRRHGRNALLVRSQATARRRDYVSREERPYPALVDYLWSKQLGGTALEPPFEGPTLAAPLAASA